MDCSKRSAGAGAAAGLPDDPLVDILSRVPAKSVCQFKCVSKAWRDLIADPHNRKKLPQAMQGLFYSYAAPEIPEVNASKVDYFSFIDLAARSVPLDIDPCFSFLTELPGIQKLVLLDSCNGLILFEHCRRQFRIMDKLGYIVCNPTTKQWRAVPTCGSPPPQFTCTYLAFDPAASSHFHLVEFVVGGEEEFVGLHAYSSETGTWSHNQIEAHEDEQGQLMGWHHQVRASFELFGCAFLNGILHLIAWDWDHKQRLILAVDVQGETRRVIAVPDMANARHCSICYFGQSQGRLHCITNEILDVYESSYSLSIWVLQDYDAQEWLLMYTLSSVEVFGEISCIGGMSDPRVVAIHQDCNLLFYAHSDKLLAYDMDSKEVSVIATFGKQIWPKDFARHVPCFSETPTLKNNP